MEAADFSGWATKAGLKCSDGRTITTDAFKHMDGLQVPLVWQHGHNNPENILGHAILKALPGGIYAYGFFNNTPKGQHAKALVQHKDINKLSIFANQLKEIGKSVLHGIIREVSLVIAGANPGALIENVTIRHMDDGNEWFEDREDEAVIHTGLTFSLGNTFETKEDVLVHKTGQEIYDTLDEEQKAFFHFVVAEALETDDDVEHADDDEVVDEETKEGNLEHQEGIQHMGTRNVFDQNGGPKMDKRHTLSHDDVKAIAKAAVKQHGGSLKAAVEAYAEEHLEHGITDIDLLFPDAKTLTDRFQFDQRRVEWVEGVLNATGKSPFSRVKTIWGDLTQDEARAKGYIKGEYKKEEWFGLSKRTTGPTTIYKKQKLDRDDVIDIRDFDVVVIMKNEMKMMLREELARAILIGDGRDVDDDDKVKDPAAASDGNGIRSILNEHEMFATTVNVNLDDASSSYTEVVDAVLLSMEHYKGSGAPTFYTTMKTLARLLLAKDTLGRRYYTTKAELALAMGVSDIVTVEPMDNEADLLGIIVNLADYNLGTDQGGETTMFDDFDIDYNLMKYLIETRLSGALSKIKSAMIIKKVASGAALVDPITVPTFVPATGVVTIPTQTGVVYKDYSDDSTLTAGAQAALDAGETLKVYAVPASGSYYFLNTGGDGPWSFKRPAA